MPPLECANFLECENKTVCVAPFGPLRPSPWIQHQFFHHIPENYHNSPCWTVFSFLAKMAWNAIVCETTDVSRENSIFPIFQKTWFQAILAKKNGKKKRKKRCIHRKRGFMECADIWQYVYLHSCGVRWRCWSAKNLWNAKNSEYAWLV